MRPGVARITSGWRCRACFWSTCSFPPTSAKRSIGSRRLSFLLRASDGHICGDFRDHTPVRLCVRTHLLKSIFEINNFSIPLHSSSAKSVPKKFRLISAWKLALNFFLFAPTARSRHSAFHDGRLAEKFVDFKTLWSKQVASCNKFVSTLSLDWKFV
jgi:hypothetical protein